MPLQIRRGTEAERSVLATPPQAGELIYITDTQQLYIGDGTTLLNALAPVTGYTDEDALDHIGSVLDAGPHTGITFVHDDATDTISATVSQPQLLQNLDLNGNDITGNGNINIIGDLTVKGKLDADFQGTISGDDSTILVDAVDNKINLDGTVKGNIIPDSNETYDIGSASNRFKDLYLSGSSIELGNATITATGTAVNLPAGSTIDGEIIQSEVSDEDAFVRDLQGSVFADDSTILVNAIDGTVKLNNGTIDITDNVITSTTFDVQISNPDDAINTTMTFYNKDNTMAQKFFSLSGVTPIDPSGIAMRGFTGGFIGSGSTTKNTAGHYIGTIQGQGYDPDFGGGTSVLSSAISFRVDPNGTVTDDTVPGQIEFQTNGNTGSAPDIKYVIFDSQGRLGVNKQSADATLDVNGFAKLAVLTAAPSTPANGMIAIADGATWDPAGTGKSVAVAYLGGGWRVMATAP